MARRQTWWTSMPWPIRLAIWIVALGIICPILGWVVSIALSVAVVGGAAGGAALAEAEEAERVERHERLKRARQEARAAEEAREHARSAEVAAVASEHAVGPAEAEQIMLLDPGDPDRAARVALIRGRYLLSQGDRDQALVVFLEGRRGASGAEVWAALSDEIGSLSRR